MSQPSSNLRPLVLGIALAIGACTSLPALAGVTCQLLDGNGNDADDGGADGGPDKGSGSDDSIACGRNAQAAGAQGTVFGTQSSAIVGGVAIGYRAIASGNFNTAMGHNANAGGQFRSTAIGSGATTTNYYSTAIGSSAQANGASSVSAGNHARAVGDFSAAYGGIRVGLSENQTPATQATRAVGFASSAFGSAAHADADESVAFGSGSTTLTGADRAVALGAQSVAGEADTVSLGHAATDLDYRGSVFGTELNRRLTHLADGVDANDAVNVQQLATVGNILATGVATYLGGGAAWNPLTGTFTAPSYTILGGSYGDVGAAFGAVNDSLTALQSGGNSVAYDTPTQDSITLAGASGTRIGNVADGVADTDAANLGQVQDGDAATLDSANAYTDQQVANATGAALGAANDYTDTRETAIRTDMAAGDAATLTAANSYTDNQIVNANAVVLNTANAYADAGDAETLSSANAHADAGDAQTLSDAQDYADAGDAETLTAANAYTDQRFTELTGLSDSFDAYKGEVDDRFNRMDRRIDKMAAMSGAYAGMAMNTSGLAGKNRIGVGVGAQGGEQAMAVGYQRAIGNRASVSLGAAFGGGEKSVSAGAGFSW